MVIPLIIEFVGSLCEANDDFTSAGDKFLRDNNGKNMFGSVIVYLFETYLQGY